MSIKPKSNSRLHTVIEAGKADEHYWLDFWRYRELFAFLAWRDIIVRYKQTVIGVLWALVRPLITTVVMTFAFGVVAGLGEGSAEPYYLVVLSGTLGWQLFSAAASTASNSMVASGRLITKVYFPRIMVPTGGLAVCTVDFLISMAFATFLFWHAGYAPNIRWLTIPIWVVLIWYISLAIGLWLTSLNVKYRDFKYIVPFILQFGQYMSPVGYTTDKVLARIPETFHALYWFNPLVGIIDGMRWAMLGPQYEVHYYQLAISLIFVTVIFFGGLEFFRKTEKTFADVM